MASFVQSLFIHSERKKNETKSLLKTSNRFSTESAVLTSQTYCESIESGLNKIRRTCLMIKENKMFND